MAVNADWILVVGASAIVDRQDVLPTALERLGGTVPRFGMAVDPGNVLLLGELDGRTVLVLTGCARSPRPNGVDFVLDRLACNVSMDESWWTALAVGGVLDAAAAW